MRAVGQQRVGVLSGAGDLSREGWQADELAV